MKNFTKLLVSIFFVGYIKFAPGTWGTLVSLLIMYILFNILSLPFIILAIIFVFLFFISNYLINYFSTITNSHDSKHIVLDELLGVFTIFLFYDFIFLLNDTLTYYLFNTGTIDLDSLGTLLKNNLPSKSDIIENIEEDIYNSIYDINNLERLLDNYDIKFKDLDTVLKQIVIDNIKDNINTYTSSYEKLAKPKKVEPLNVERKNLSDEILNYKELPQDQDNWGWKLYYKFRKFIYKVSSKRV